MDENYLKGCSPKIDIDLFEERVWNQRVFADDKVSIEMIFVQSRFLYGYAGVHYYVKGWSPKIHRDIFEEPENLVFWEKYKSPKIRITASFTVNLAGPYIFLKK